MTGVSRSERVIRSTFIGVALVLLTSGAATAQTIHQFFSLSTPGARANAMGGAFIAVANDATASITNPAGLVLLTRPQAYVEIKNAFFEEPDLFLAPGTSLSFASLSTPLGSRLAAAVTFHEFYRVNLVPDLQDRGTTFGGSLAAALAPTFKVGVTLSGTWLTSTDGFFDETSFGIGGGALWTPMEKVSFGVSGYRSSSLNLPNRFGGGISLSATPRLLIAFDAGWVTYPSDELLGVESSVETHVGGEYRVLSGERSVFLRAGFTTDSAGSDLFAGDEKNVGTFGVGLTLGRRSQIDVAFLTRKELIVSAAVRF